MFLQPSSGIPDLQSTSQQSSQKHVQRYLESLEHKSTLAVGHVGVHVRTKWFVEEVEFDITAHL